MSAPKEKKAQIRELLDQQLSCREISDKLGVGIMVVAGFKAALTRAGGKVGVEVADALETTFGLERHLQEALRFGSNIEQLGKDSRSRMVGRSRWFRRGASILVHKTKMETW